MSLPPLSPTVKVTAAVGVTALAATLAFGVFGVHTLFIDREVYEPLPEMAAAPTPQPLAAEVPPPSPGAPIAQPAPLAAPVPPTLLRKGRLVEVDAYHRGEGPVQLWQQADGSQFVRFDDVAIANGPDLWVFVSDAATPGNTLESLGNYTDLGKLKGNVGSQNYQLPTLGFAPKSVVVWCKRFGVLFTYATLE
jgi:hypothetical protein